MQDVRERLEAAIKSGKTTVAEVVRVSGVSLATVNRIRDPSHDPTMSSINAISEALDKIEGIAPNPVAAGRLERMASEMAKLARQLRGTEKTKPPHVPDADELDDGPANSEPSKRRKR